MIIFIYMTSSKKKKYKIEAEQTRTATKIRGTCRIRFHERVSILCWPYVVSAHIPAVIRIKRNFYKDQVKYSDQSYMMYMNIPSFVCKFVLARTIWEHCSVWPWIRGLLNLSRKQNMSTGRSAITNAETRTT